jgi:uncharacterized protein YwqG
MDLTLIEKINISGTDTYFYDGIDFDMIRDHKEEYGFLIFFVDSYINSVKAWERQSRLDSVLEDKDLEDFDSEKYQKNHIAIYQTSGNLIPVYETIKKKILEMSNQAFPFKIKDFE